MNIVHVVRNLDRYSGAAYQALNLARHQYSSHLNVTVLNISDSGFEGRTVVDDICVLTVKRNSSVFKLYKILSSFSIAHFHGMFLKSIAIARIARCKIILKTTLLGEDDFGTIYRRRFGTFRMAILRWVVDLNNALSSPILEINKNFLSADKIAIIPNFVAENLFVNSVAKENLIVYVGAVVERKRVLDAIDFFEKKIQPHGYKMAIIGPSNIIECDDDSLYILRFKERLAQNPSLTYLGKLEQKEVLSVLAKSKSLIFLSDKEGMPNVVLEALAANCFVITSSISGVAKDIYQHGIQGFDVDSGDIFDCKYMENSVANEFPLKLAIGKFYFSRNANIYEKIYKEMLID